jgi:hypothetical protein
MNSQVQIPKAATAPVIDGNMDAVWDNAFIDSTRCVVGGEGQPDRSNFSGEFRLLWDDNGFYIFVSVTDDIILVSNTAEPWNNDNLGIRLDGGNERSSQYDQNDVAMSWQYNFDDMMSALNHSNYELFSVDDFSNCSFASQVTGTGLNYEIALSGTDLSDMLSLNLAAGTEFGFLITITDNDEGTEWDYILSTEYYDYLCPATWSFLRLVNTVEHPVNIVIPKTIEAPIIDGQMDPIWDNTQSEPITLLPINLDPPIDETDFSANYRLLWDDNNIYIFIAVTDNDIYTDQELWYQNDALSLFIDVGNEKKTSYARNDIHQAFVFGRDSMVSVSNSYNELPLTSFSNCQFASRQTIDGYNYEILLSGTDFTEQLGFELKEGVLFGLEIEVIDNDFGEDRDHLLTIFSRIESYWQNPSGWGTAYLNNSVIYPAHINLAETVEFPSRSKGSDYRASDYRIIGLPGASNILMRDLFSGEQNYDWQVYRDNGDADVDAAFEAYNGTDLFRCEAGRAFWVLNKGRLTIDQGSINTIPSNNDGEVAIDLHPGWNLITNPFPIPVAWEKVKNTNALDANANIWDFNGSFGNVSTRLDPFRGYYFNNNTNLDFLMIPYDPEGINLDKVITNDHYSWKVNISLTHEEITDKSSYLAVCSDAATGWDKNEFYKPRAFKIIPGIYFNHPEWNKDYSSFANDVQPPFTEIKNWEFTVQTPSLTESELSFSGMDDIPEEFSVYLIDNTNMTSVNLRENDKYIFTPLTQISLFTISIGKDEFVQAKLNDLLPKEYSLDQNFPNPFNPSTTISFTLPVQSHITLKVYNITGQQVKSLLAKNMDAGIHYIRWDGKDDRGAKVASGLYIYHMRTATGKHFSGKMVLLK